MVVVVYHSPPPVPAPGPGDSRAATVGTTAPRGAALTFVSRFYRRSFLAEGPAATAEVETPGGGPDDDEPEP